MRLDVSDDFVEVRLARWEKTLGLMGDIRVARAAVGDVRVVEDPMREVLSSGLKAGLRLPWVYYVARSIKLDRAWILRRGLPALSFSVNDGGTLRGVVVSTPEAEALAQRLGAPAGAAVDPA
jgi:hypothetical protein